MGNPRNENSQVDAMLMLATAMSRGSADGLIEEQEARGQKQLAGSSVLPTKILRGEKSTLEMAGVVFGSPVEGDAIFTNVTLPDGWKIEPTDHSMWSDLLDNESRKRASLFYKAAFYDRSAHMSIEERRNAED